MIDKYGEHLLPDLKHYFGIDLRGLFLEEEPLSPRYVLTHIRWLPLESAFAAETRGGQQFRDWGGDRYMAAAQINAMRTLIWILIVANSDPKKAKPSPPEVYPVPDKTPKPKSTSDKPGSFAYMIATAKKRKAAT